eukprot:Selendium_serpulae@DN5493_c0_g3_i1.p1
MATSSRNDFDRAFKLVLVGNSGVGKSGLLLRFADDTFTESYITTIGVDFRYRTVIVDNESLRLQIWDTAGQERFRTITSAYYRGADGIVLVYDTSDRDSFNQVDEWLAEVNRYISERTACKILVGNKSDLTAKRAVTLEEGEAKAAELEMIHFETSAKTSQNVELAFTSIARQLVKLRDSAPTTQGSGGPENGVRVQESQQTGLSMSTMGSCCGGGGGDR